MNHISRGLYLLIFIYIISLLGFTPLVAAGETINFTGFTVQPIQSIDVQGYTPVCYHDGTGSQPWNNGAVGAIAFKQNFNGLAYQMDNRLFYTFNVSKIIE